MTRDHWLNLNPVIETHDGIQVLRDDLIEGGSKIRFLPYLTHGADEIVYGGPFCGGTPLALSVLGREMGQRVTLFYGKRKDLHARQIKAQANGAMIEWVGFGRMSNVQAKARAYAERSGALFLKLGLDQPEGQAPFVEFFLRLRQRIGSPGEVWCAVGSGMLARCLGLAFPDSAIHGVAVGLESRHLAQAFTPNVRLLQSPYKFSEPAKASAPFPSCGFYERKAWERCIAEGRGSRLFVNVMGE